MDLRSVDDGAGGVRVRSKMGGVEGMSGRSAIMVRGLSQTLKALCGKVSGCFLGIFGTGWGDGHAGENRWPAGIVVGWSVATDGRELE